MLWTTTERLVEGVKRSLPWRKGEPALAGKRRLDFVRCARLASRTQHACLHAGARVSCLASAFHRSRCEPVARTLACRANREREPCRRTRLRLSHIC